MKLTTKSTIAGLILTLGSFMSFCFFCTRDLRYRTIFLWQVLFLDAILSATV